MFTVDMLGQNKVGLNGTNIIALNRLNGIQMGSSARHGNHPVTSTMTVHNRGNYIIADAG